MIRACEIAFPTAIPLRSFRHFRQNVESHINTCGLQRFKAEIIGQIFGSDESDGLLESESGDEFDLRLQQLSTLWESWQGGLKLADYIKDRSDMMKNSMISEVRSRAGMGYPPEKFYDNDSESNNERIKQRMEHREAGLCSFVRGMKQLAASQENELVKALYGSSKEYRVRDAFSSFIIQPDDWYEMSEVERCKKVAEFHKLPIEEMYAADTATCTPTSSIASTTHDGNDSETGEHPYDISIKADESGLANVLPCQVVQGIWGKATKLLKKYNSSICRAPSAIAKVKAFSVLNQSGKDRVPYYIEVHTCSTCTAQCSHVKVTCTCPMYKPNQLCSHSVAVAEKNGLLLSFIQWRIKTKKAGNFMSLATVDINTSKSGRKGGKVKRSRAAKNTTVPTTQSSGTRLLLTQRAQSNVTPRENTRCTGGRTATNLSSSTQLPNPHPPHMQWHPNNSVQGTNYLPDQQQHGENWVFPNSTQIPSFASGNISDSQVGNLDYNYHIQLFSNSSSNTIPSQFCPSETFPTQPLGYAPLPQSSSMFGNFSTIPVYSTAVAQKPWHNNNPFIVMKINGRISKCAGCKGNFQKMPNKSACPPPLDLVILHVEKDEYPYKNPATAVVETRVSSEKRKYYHPNPSCILKRHSYFNNTMLGFSDTAQFTDVHREHIAQMFQLSH